MSFRFSLSLRTRARLLIGNELWRKCILQDNAFLIPRTDMNFWYLNASHHWHYAFQSIGSAKIAIKRRLASGIFKSFASSSASISIDWFNNRYWWTDVPQLSRSFGIYNEDALQKEKRRNVDEHDKPSAIDGSPWDARSSKKLNRPQKLRR